LATRTENIQPHSPDGRSISLRQDIDERARGQCPQPALRRRRLSLPGNRDACYDPRRSRTHPRSVSRVRQAKLSRATIDRLMSMLEVSFEKAEDGERQWQYLTWRKNNCGTDK
jgi:hypothetical protein